MSNKEKTSKKIEELQAQAKRVKEQSAEAKEVMDRLFNEELDADEAWELMAKAGKFMLDAVDLREKLTGAKMLNIKGLAAAKKIEEILKEDIPDSEVIFGKNEISNTFYVECFRTKGVGFSGETWKKLYPLLGYCSRMSALIDDFDDTIAGFSIGFSPLYFTAPKTPEQL